MLNWLKKKDASGAGFEVGQKFYDLEVAEQVQLLRSLSVQALDSWGLSEAKVNLIKYRENAVFAVTAATGERYAIRVHRAHYHTNAELESELALMGALARHGIQTPPTIPTLDGKLFVILQHAAIPEPRQIDLLGWVDGTPIGTVENDVEMSPELVRKNHVLAGKLAAQIHNFTESWTPPAGFTRRHWNEEGLFGDNAHFGCFWKYKLLSEDQKSLLLEARVKLRDELAAFGKAPDRFGLTQGDFLPENLLSDGESVRIIDFDDCGYGWHLMDLATSLFFLVGEPSFDVALDGLVAGYRSERLLPDDHLAHLQALLLARGFSFMAWAQSRSETETAKELGPMLVEGVCALAAEYLGSGPAADAFANSPRAPTPVETPTSSPLPTYKRALEGKVALITGARSPKGMGFAAALKLAEAGADIVMTTRTDGDITQELNVLGDERFDAFKALVAKVEAHQVRCLALPMDVAEADQVAAVTARAAAEFGGIDILFNNAGTAFGAAFTDTTPAMFQEAFDVNVQGLIRTSQAVIPSMIERGGGVIINNASIYGLGAAPFVSAYVMTKHAIVGLSKTMALELGEVGIRVNAICPGMVLTEMGDKEYELIAQLEGCTIEEARDGLAQQNALKRGAQPEEVAELVAFLSTTAASFITGAAIPVAAGQPAGL